MARKPTRAERDLGIVVPDRHTEKPMSLRLKKDDMRKLLLLADRLKVGPSTMVRLIVEKFIKQHDPDR
jgi:hypothetical protein